MQAMFRFAKCAMATLAMTLPGIASASAALPAAVEAQCLARSLQPEITQTSGDRIDLTPVIQRQQIIEATYRTEIIRVTLKAATTRLEVIPAQYKTITQQMLVSPETEVRLHVPARYEASSAAPLLIPAMAGTVHRMGMMSPATFERRVIPARYRTVSKRVMTTPSRVEEIIVDAVYIDVPVVVQTRAEPITAMTIPATDAMVERDVLKAPESVSRTPVLCQNLMTPAKITQIQTALSEAGFPAASDGIFGPKTRSALQNFQRANNLAGGYLTLETLLALGLDPHS